MLIKNAEALERFEKVDTLVVDKTGTLTEGKPKVVSVTTTGDVREDELLRFAADLERGSGHPLAAAIIEEAKRRGLPIGKTSDFNSPSGKGVTGTVEGRRIALGNRKLFADLGIAVEALESHTEAQRAEGATVILAGIDGKPAGAIAIADPIKESTPETINALEAGGYSRRDAHRRQSQDGRGGRPKARDRPGRGRRAAARQGRDRQAAAGPRATSWRWPATGSTTPLRSLPPMSASPWAPGPTSPWRAQASRC